MNGSRTAIYLNYNRYSIIANSYLNRIMQTNMASIDTMASSEKEIMNLEEEVVGIDEEIKSLVARKMELE